MQSDHYRHLKHESQRVGDDSHLNLSVPKAGTRKLDPQSSNIFRGLALNSNKVLNKNPVYEITEYSCPRGSEVRSPPVPQSLTNLPNGFHEAQLESCWAV